MRRRSSRTPDVKGLTPFGRNLDNTLGGDATFVRNTPATYINANGDMQSAVSGEARFTANGYFGEIASTNKCTNYNANPASGAVAMGTAAAFNAAVTNVTAFDFGTGCLFGVVDGASALAAAGLDDVCSSGLLLKIDNTSGTSAAAFNVGGGTSNTNAHSLIAWAMADSGSTAQLRLNDGVGSVTTANTTLTKLTSENITPTAAGIFLQMRVVAGDVAYFILNQLEESAFSTSEIITEGAAATRNKDELSYPTTLIPVNDCVFSFDWTPTAAGQGVIVLASTGTDASNRLMFIFSGTLLFLRKRVATVNYDATKAVSYVAGTTYSFKGRVDSVNGVDLWIDDVIGTGHSNTDDVVLGSSIYVGADWDGTFQQAGGVNNFTVHKGNYTDAEVVAL